MTWSRFMANRPTSAFEEAIRSLRSPSRGLVVPDHLFEQEGDLAGGLRTSTISPSLADFDGGSWMNRTSEEWPGTENPIMSPC